MSIQWAQEACDRYFDPLSGAKIIQLTSGSYTSNNIFCEQPYTSPDGNRIALIRKPDFSFDSTAWLLCVDLPSLRITMIDRAVIGPCTSAWSGYIYYANPSGELTRVNLANFEKSVMNFDDKLSHTMGGASVSPDHRYMIYPQTLAGSRETGATIAIVRVDLKKHTREVIFQNAEITRPQMQFNPIHGKHILVQHNRGSKMSPDGSVTKRVGDQGTTLFVIDSDGTNLKPLAVGAPYTAPCTGHHAFVADTGRVLFTTAWNLETWALDKRQPKGNLFTAAPGEDQPRVFEAPEHRFNHVSVSRCGRYFVADSHNDGLFDANRVGQTTSLIIGNLATGKYRPIVQATMASGGGNQSTHAHAYFTADTRCVIYNADPYYASAQVFAAQIPSGFLESLS